MKKLLLFLLFISFSFSSFSQYNFYKLTGGIGAGAVALHGDIDSKINPAMTGRLEYNFTPFSSGGIEVQSGTFTGDDKWGRDFKSSFIAANVNAKLTLGQVVDFEASNFLYRIRNLYIGAGVGYIKTSTKERVDQFVYPDGYVNVFNGGRDGVSVYFPVNLGYRFDIQDRFGFNRYAILLNYQFSTSLKDNLDTYYHAPASHQNKYTDFYSLLTFGVQLSFGPEGLY